MSFLLLSLCVLVANAQVFPFPDLAANVTGKVKIPSIGEFPFAGWIASTATDSVYKNRAHISLTVSGMKMESDTWTFMLGTQYQVYSLVQGQCHGVNQKVDPNVAKQCATFTWKQGLFNGNRCMEGTAECKIVDNSTGIAIDVSTKLYTSMDKKTPLGTLSVTSSTGIQTTTSMTFSNVNLGPVPASNFALPPNCSQKRSEDAGEGFCPVFHCSAFGRGCDNTCTPLI